MCNGNIFKIIFSVRRTNYTSESADDGSQERIVAKDNGDSDGGGNNSRQQASNGDKQLGREADLIHICLVGLENDFHTYFFLLVFGFLPILPFPFD